MRKYVFKMYFENFLTVPVVWDSHNEVAWHVQNEHAFL